MNRLLVLLALFVAPYAQASWVYQWEGQCGGAFAFGCSTVDATFTVPDAYHPGTSFACYGFERCVDYIDTVWTINYPDRPSITTTLAPRSFWYWNAQGTLPTGPHDGTISLCHNSCGDVGINIGTSITGGITWTLMDGYRFVSGLEYEWAPPQRVDEPGVLALLVLGLAALLARSRRKPVQPVATELVVPSTPHLPIP